MAVGFSSNKQKSRKTFDLLPVLEGYWDNKQKDSILFHTILITSMIRKIDQHLLWLCLETFKFQLSFICLIFRFANHYLRY